MRYHQSMAEGTKTFAPESDHESGNRSSARRFRLSVIGIFAFGFVLRLLHAWQVQLAPFSDLKLGDARTYDAWAHQIAAGNWLGGEIFYQAPLYPYFLAVIYALLGDDLLLVRIVQGILSSVSCVLLYLAGRRLFNESAGLAAGLILAIYAPAIFLDGLIQKSVIELMLLCLVIWLLSGLITNPRMRSSWWSGVALGLLTLARENSLIYVPVILAWLLIHFRDVRRRSLLLALVFVLGLAAPLVPVGVRNYVVGGEFHLTTSQFGPNFYIGNNENADGTYKPLVPGRGDARVERQDAINLAELAEGRSLTPAEVSRYWTGRAIDYITSQPGDWLKLQARKLVLVFNATEIQDTEDQYTCADASVVLKLTGYVCHFGIIAPLGLLGFWMTRKERRKLWLLYAMWGIYLATVLFFCVFARYRYPLVPFLVLFAGAGLVALPHVVRSRSPKELAGIVVGAVVLFGFCNWPVIPRQWMRSTTNCNYGEGMLAAGRTEAALAYFDKALEITPRFPHAYMFKGNALVSKGELDAAIDQYRRALEIRGDLVEARHNLARTLALAGRIGESIDEYGEVLRFDPRLAEAHHGLGRLFASQGRTDEAIAHIRQAVQLDPNNPRLRCTLAAAIAEHGDPAEAATHFAKALELQPGLAEANYGLAKVALTLGNNDEAIDRYRRVLQTSPDHPLAHFELGNVLRSEGRYSECLDHYKEALRIKPHWPFLLNRVALILAAHPDPSVRELAEAVALAQRAVDLTNRQDPAYLDTLAAAHASLGEYVLARSVAEEALALASEANNPELVDHIRSVLALYRQSRPYRMQIEGD